MSGKQGPEKCVACGKTVYAMEKLAADNKIFHDKCFKCMHCGKRLELGTFAAVQSKYYCKPHYHSLFMSKGNYSEGFAQSEKQQQQAPAPAPAPPSGAPAPPPPPPADLLADLGSADSGSSNEGGAMSAALAQIASGGPKLKHVSREERKRKPVSSVVPGGAAPKKKEEKAHAEEKVVKGDPVCKLEDKKWTVRFQQNRQEDPVTVEITDLKQSVAISNCSKAVVIVKGKLTNISIMNCDNLGVVFDDVVAAVEVIRSKKVQLQANGQLAQVALDNSANIDIFIQSAAGKSVEIVTALTEGVNVTFPGENAEADPVEYPIPMQFISNLKDGKLVTAPSSHV